MKDELDKPLKSLINKLPQQGSLLWIGIRPGRKQELVSLQEVGVSTDQGLNGDHFASTYSKDRQVTLIQHEHLQAVASILNEEEVSPKLTRRNLVISGINLIALRTQRFRIGEVVLEGTGYCHPCSRMEENLGPGGYNAMRGHGGITAKVISGGTIRVGDTVTMI